MEYHSRYLGEDRVTEITPALCHYPSLRGLCPRPRGFEGIEAPLKYQPLIKKGSPKTPPDDDISSSPIRLSLGELLLSRARFRFTGPLFPWRAWNVFISSDTCLTWQARIKIQKEFFIKLSLLLLGPNGQEFSCHGIEQS